MEEITQGVNNINLAADSHKKNRIQVSNTKKPLFFYVNLAKVSICTAIATVVTIAEILKNNGLAVEKKITTTTVDMKEDSRGRPVQKAKRYMQQYNEVELSALGMVFCVYLGGTWMLN
ncbi:hypothetical protein GOBAR_DD36790 [Gossypium barbadense]|nr:hypothetical protein GOBAR_DD36790 [Gossypium barbadense]